MMFSSVANKKDLPIGKPELKPHSCKHCQTLIIDLKPAKVAQTKHIEEKRWRTSVFMSKIEEDDTILFNFTLTQCSQAAFEECTLCQWILDDAGLNLDHGSYDWLMFAKIYHYKKGFDINRVEFFGFCSPDLSRTMAKTRHGFAIYAMPGKPDELRTSYFSSWFQLTLEHLLNRHAENIAAKFVTTRPINAETASDHSFSLARNWMRKCIDSHISCIKPSGCFLPTRVIEITHMSEGWKLRLVNAKDSHIESYTALSYCWGGDLKLKATQATISDFRVSIPYEQLPKTIQDAIITTDRLGIRNLWVDSLCIIQDDAQDVSTEIAQMAHIYSGATVTIAASIAENANQGFLHPRSVTDHPDLVFQLPFRGPEGEVGSVQLFVPTRDEEIEPLDRRAWALQERLLSSRILEFGTHQLRWTCAGVETGEGFVDGWTIGDDRQGGSKAILDHEAFKPTFKENDEWLSEGRSMKLGGLLEHWHGIRRAYTKRALTQSSDRIAAISGIAQRYGDIFQSPYLAGLWEFALIYELLWKVDSTSKLRTRPAAQGPSWSWVSICGSISNTDRWSLKELTACMKITGRNMSLYNLQAPYGSVISGSLTVRAKIRQAQCIWKEAPISIFNRGFCILGENDEPLAAHVFLDALDSELSQSTGKAAPVFLLQVFTSDGSHYLEPVGLILRQLNGSHFMRLGVYQFKNFLLDQGKDKHDWKARDARFRAQINWLNDAPEQTVILV